MVFFLDIRTAPFERLEDKITGKSKGVMQIAIATANVNAVTGECFQAFRMKTIGVSININLINNLLILSIPVWKADFGFPVIVCAILPKYVLSPVLMITPFAEPLITLVPIKQIVSKSEILSKFSIEVSEFTTFFTASDSPVNDDCPTYKSVASITLKSAGIMLPADSTTISPKVTSLIGICISLPSLITTVVVATSSFNFSAALLERNSSKNSSNVLAATKIAITIILAKLGVSGRYTSV